MRALLVMSGCTALLACGGGERPRPASSEAGEGDVWIHDVTLVSPERAAPLAGAHVHLRGGRIAWVGTRRPPDLPPDVREIDGTGRFLVPGLIDAHVHLSDVPGVESEHAAAMPRVVEAYFDQLPRSYLYFGFTALIDLVHVDRELMEKMRAAPFAPAIFDCGGSLPLANGYPMSFFPPAKRFAAFPNFLHDPGQAAAIPPEYPPAEHSPAAAVARVAKAGGICVKTYFEPGVAAVTGKLPTPTVELMREVVAASHARRLPVLLHANSLAAHRFAVASKVDVVVHGLFKWESEGSLDKLPAKLPAAVIKVLDDEVRAGIATMPTLRIVGGGADLLAPEFLQDPQLARVLPADLLDWYRSEAGGWYKRKAASLEELPPERLRPIIARFEQAGGAAARYFADHGGRLLFGSDTPSEPTYTNPPGYNGYLEMRALERAGITAARILEAATRANAERFGLASQYGTIEPGKRASLLILRSDPLVGVSAFDTIERVIVDGRVVSRSELAAR